MPAASPSDSIDHRSTAGSGVGSERRWIRFLLVALLLVAALFARPEAYAQAGPTPSADAAEEEIYRIGPLDRLSITVFGEPDLSRSVTVRPDGRFSVPFAENVVAADRTPEQVARDLELRLAAFVRDPIVTVAVENALGDTDQRIRVIGAAASPTEGETTREAAELGRAAVLSRDVGQPRDILYRSGLTLVDVIEAVGGLSVFAAGNNAYIVRRQGDTTVNVPVRIDDLVKRGDPTANAAMAPGDILVIPEGAFSGKWSLEPTVGTFLTGTDNVALVPNEFKDPGMVMTVAPGIILRATTPRFAASLDADVQLRYKEVFGGNTLNVDDGFDAVLDLLGASTTEIASNTLFFDLNAAITQQAQNSDDATSLSPFIDTNRSTTASVVARPFLLHRFGDYANGTLTYTLSAFVQNDDNDSSVFDAFSEDSESNITNEIRYGLQSGTEFPKFRWGFNALASEQSRSDQSNVRRADVDLDGRYPLNRAFDFTASIGYQWFRDGTTNDFDGIAWSVGGDYHPSPRFRLSLSYGRRDDGSNWAAFLNYDISPRTNFRLSYSEELTTSEQAFSQSVGGLQRDADGNIIGSDGQPFDPATGDFDFDDQTQFRRSFSASFSTQQGPNVFGLNGRITMQESRPEGTNDDTYSINGSWTRSLNASTTGQLSVGYTIRQEDVEDDNTFSAQVRVDRTLLRTLDGFATYGFQIRDSNISARDFMENVVTLGLLKRF